MNGGRAEWPAGLRTVSELGPWVRLLGSPRCGPSTSGSPNEGSAPGPPANQPPCGPHHHLPKGGQHAPIPRPLRSPRSLRKSHVRAEEFGPEGAGEARSEFAHDYTSRPEMHSGYPARSIDDDDSGSYRFVPLGEGKYRVPIPHSAVTGRYKRPIGFTRNGE